MNIGEWLVIVGGWSAVLIGAWAWLSRLLTERMLSQWRRDEQRAVETLRNDFAANRVLLEAALRSHESGLDQFQQKRLAAVERLWIAVLE